ncbi:hypothetical protein [Microbacterium suaedae]|uniref:hypothetical protein n=1 Tax=Microbacterium suaedae TaxID=2067813 RepID=UPI0013A5F803|nr:hypothetical protein [Microbacterium suaedae]
MKVRNKLATIAAAAVVLVGGGGITAATANTTEPTDREVVQGLLFGNGEFASEVNNEVVIEDSAVRAEYEQGIEEALDEFLDAESDAVAGYANDIRSGDINRVDAGLDGLAETYMAHAEETVGEEALAAVAEEQGVTPQACGVAVVCVAYAAVAVHNTVALTALAGAVVGAAVACGAWWVDCTANSAAVTTQNSRAAQEQFVAEVTVAARD